MKINCWTAHRSKGLLSPYLFILFVFLACSKSDKTFSQGALPTYAPPVTVMVDTCPPPKIQPFESAQNRVPISIIKTSEGSFELRYLDGRSIPDMNPPTVHESDVPKANFTNFDTEDGLALSTVICAHKDTKGNLWFGTQGGGVSCYNGKRFTNYRIEEGLVENNVRGIVEDENGNIWIGTDGGLSCFNGQRFTNYNAENGLWFGSVRSMIIDEHGIIWLGILGIDDAISFDTKLIEADGLEFKRLIFPDHMKGSTVRSIIEDKNGNLWFGHFNGLIRYNRNHENTIDKQFSHYTSKQGLASNQVRSMVEDRNGNIWIGAWGSGLCLYDPEKDKLGLNCFTTWSEEHGISSNFIRSMWEDVKGNLWLGTWGGGISRLDFESIKPNSAKSEHVKFTNYGSFEGLAHDNVQCIMEDNGGNLWIGTLGGGISRFNGESVLSYTLTHDLLLDRVKSMTEDHHGNLWICPEDGGMSRFNGENYINYKLTKSSFPVNYFAACVDRNGDLWLGTYGSAILKFEAKPDGTGVFMGYSWNSEIVGGTTSTIFEDRKGNLWFGNRGNGICKFDGKEFVTFSTQQGLVNNFVTCITENQNGELWIGTSKGASLFQENQFTNYTVHQGLGHDHIVSMVADQYGNLWFGTLGGGISRYDGKEFLNFTTSHGLADNVVHGLKIDEQGILWIGGNLGLSSLQFRTPAMEKKERELTGVNLNISNWELKKYLPVWEIYNSSTGYPIKDMFDNAMVLSKVGLPEGDQKDIGVIWGGYGDEKVIRFDPKAIRKNDEPLQVFIESINIKEEVIPWYQLASFEIDSTVIGQQEIRTYGRALVEQERVQFLNRFGNIRFNGISNDFPLPQNLVLPFQHNQISFEYGAIETGRPKQVRYQYKLDGYDTDWNPATAKTSATYGNMNEGSYTFHVKALSPDGVWSDPSEFSFRVMPPWWRSLWAYLFYVILFGFCLWMAHRIQKRRVLRLEKEKTQAKELEQAKEIEKAYTDLKNTQAQLIQSEKMASLGELTAGIAHEIQNPLNFVNNFSEVSGELLDEVSDEIDRGNSHDAKEIISDLKLNLEKITVHGKRADSIVKAMLQHSRTSSGKKEPVNINELCNEYLRMAYHGFKAKNESFNATYETDFEKNLPSLSVISQDVGRVLLNLINNAFHAVSSKALATEDGDYKPKVRVKTELAPLEGGLGGDGSIQITISDNGSGIPEDIKDKIFQPFFTTKPTGEGTGLGLSLSYDIVKAHGGEMTVESKVGTGTNFMITLPIVREEDAVTQQQ